MEFQSALSVPPHPDSPSFPTTVSLLCSNRHSRPPQECVSSDQALTVSQRCGCELYVETSARECARSAISAFEVAGLVAMGHLAGAGAGAGAGAVRRRAASTTAAATPARAPGMPPPVPPKPARYT